MKSYKFWLPILLATIHITDVRATDEIVCSSSRFNVSLAIGTSGFVASVVISDASGKLIPSPVVIERLKKRKVWIDRKSMHVEGKVPRADGGRLLLKMNDGRGYVLIGPCREKLSCDWKR